MSEVNNGSGAAPVVSGAQGTESGHSASGAPETRDTVSFATYDRTMAELKKAKAEREALAAALEAERQNKLQAEGKKDELLEAVKRERDDLHGKLKGAVGSFAKARVREVLLGEAQKLGCVDPSLLIKAYGNDVSEIEFDDEFNPNKDQVAVLLNKIKTEHSHMFSKPGPNVGNHQVKGFEAPGPTPISKMKDEDLHKKLAEIWQQTKA
jgi:hypothetical protein